MMPDDQQLLDAFTRTGSPDAFRDLVTRHIDMVYAAACRQVGDRHAAEDVTQAVFIVLACQARTVRNAALLPAWLLKVTHSAAGDARKAAARRHKHEQEGGAMLPTTSLPPDPEWDKLSPHLDAALARLSATDRAAVVAHCIQEKPIAEVAADLGISEPAARKRVQRALEQLRAILGPKASMPCLALAALIASHAVARAPPALAATITTTALAALHGTAATGTAFALAKGVMHMMFLDKAKLAVAATLALIILTTITGTAVHYALAQTAPKTLATTAATAAPTSPPLPAHPSEPASQPADWRPQFSQIYRLDPGQVIKFIPEPLIAQREGYWQARLAEFAAARGSAPPTTWRVPSTMVFMLRDTDQVQTNSGLYIPNSTPGLAGVLKALTLSLANAPSAMLKPDIGPQFANVTLRGDWIVRDDTRGRWLVRDTPVPDAVWRDLEKILKDRTGRTIRFEKRTIDRECVVVQGRLTLVPLDNQHDDGAVYVPLRVAGDSTVAAFLHALSVWTGCAFVDETQSSSERLRWRVQPAASQPVVFHTAPSTVPSTAPTGDSPPVDNTIDRMLADLARQTSLQFRKEKRPVEVITAVEGP